MKPPTLPPVSRSHLRRPPAGPLFQSPKPRTVLHTMTPSPWQEIRAGALLVRARACDDNHGLAPLGESFRPRRGIAKGLASAARHGRSRPEGGRNGKVIRGSADDDNIRGKQFSHEFVRNRRRFFVTLRVSLRRAESSGDPVDVHETQVAPRQVAHHAAARPAGKAEIDFALPRN